MTSVAAFSASTPAQSGCALLLETSEKTCTAKVDCSRAAPQLAQAETLYQACKAGAYVSLADVEALFKACGGPLAYQCCIGNALHQKFKDP